MVLIISALLTSVHQVATTAPPQIVSLVQQYNLRFQEQTTIYSSLLIVIKVKKDFTILRSNTTIGKEINGILGNTFNSTFRLSTATTHLQQYI